MTTGERVRYSLQNAAIYIAVVLLLACIALASAVAQTKPPPEPAPFKAMKTPLQPGTPVSPPANALITPSLLTPQTGAQSPQPGFSGSKMVMTQAVWQRYVKYLRDDLATGFGFFMITVDGTAADVKQCNGYACQISPISQDAALRDCRARLDNRRCVVFAEGRNIKYAYQVVP